MTTILCDRMQHVKMAGAPTEPRLYHYCYVCNTQLNSCKQALLHCSGKRHRKKLQFLQTRSHSHTNGSIGAAGSITHSMSQESPYVQPLYQNTLQSSHSFPNLAYPPPMDTANGGMHYYSTAKPAAICGGGAYYPMLSPSAMAGTDQWLNGPPPAQPPPPQILVQQVATAVGYGAAPPLPRAHVTESLGSLRLADRAPSSEARAAVLSPSETSSLSSSDASLTHSYRCHVCNRQFMSGVQLHGHLQASKHYKPHYHQFYYTPAGLSGKGDSSETDSTSSLYYCSVCSIAVNSHTQLRSHNAGQKHRLRVGGPQQPKRHSRSSSTSSDFAGGDPPTCSSGGAAAESGYTSGSGDELLRIMQTKSDDGVAASFRCKLCSTTLNSLAQARQHLKSPKHMQRATSRPSLRKKSVSFRKKHASGTPRQQDAATSPCECEHDECLSDGADTSETPSPVSDAEAAADVVERLACSL